MGAARRGRRTSTASASTPATRCSDRHGRRAQGLDDPPHGPAGGSDGEPMPAQVVPMLATPRRAAARRRRLGATRSSGTACGRSPTAEPGRAAAGEPQPQRHHRAGTRSCAARTGRSAATARSSTARSSPSTPTGGPTSSALQRRMHLTSERAVRRLAKSAPGHVRALRPALAGRPLPDGAALRRAPRAAARSSGSTASAGRRRTTSSATAPSCWPRAASRGSRGSWPSGWSSTYEPGRRCAGWVKVKNVRASGVRRRRLAARRRRPAQPDRRAARRVPRRRGRRRLRYVGRVGTGFTEGELDRLAASLAPLEHGHVAVRGGRQPRPEARTGPGPRSWPRSSSATGPRRAAARTGLQGAARGQAAPLVVRDERDRAVVVADGRRCGSRTSTRSCIRPSASRSATSSTTPRGSPRSCCRTSRAGR